MYKGGYKQQRYANMESCMNALAGKPAGEGWSCVPPGGAKQDHPGDSAVMYRCMVKACTATRTFAAKPECEAALPSQPKDGFDYTCGTLGRTLGQAPTVAARAKALTDSNGDVRLWRYGNGGYGTFNAPYPSIAACQSDMRTRAASGDGYRYSCGVSSDPVLAEQMNREATIPPQQASAPPQLGATSPPARYNGGGFQDPSLYNYNDPMHLISCTSVRTTGGWVRDCRSMPMPIYGERACIKMRDLYRTRSQAMNRPDFRVEYECVRALPAYEVVR
jgi:hypothetical protein